MTLTNPLAWDVVAENLGKTVTDGDETLPILTDISIRVPAGSSAAVVGPSGCGKSTLLGLLAGLDVPSTGRVCWAGEEISCLDEEDRSRRRRGNLGFVFQSFQLLPHLSALENVLLPLELTAAPNARAVAEEMLAAVGLGGRLHHFPSTLSGGEQQRVALARAFVSKPRLLLADEPTGSLDAASGERVMEIFFDLQRQTQTTLVLVTHDVGLAQQCGQQIRLAAGRLV